MWSAILLAGLACITAASAATLSEDSASACGGLAGSFDAVRIDSATLQPASPLAVAERAPTPAGRVVAGQPGVLQGARQYRAD